MAKVVNVYKEPFTMYIGRKNPKFGAGSKFANKSAQEKMEQEKKLQLGTGSGCGKRLRVVT